MDIKALSRQGMSIRHIARTTGLSRVTVRRALMQTVPKSYGPRLKRPGKLSAYEGYLLEQLQGRPWVRATTLFEEVRSRGYGGHYEGVKRFVRARRREERARRRACVLFETAPGQEGQLDWKGPIRGLLSPDPAGALFFFRHLLGFSRYRVSFVAFTLRLPEALWDLRRAFEALGGVPHRLVLDNFKGAVLRPKPHLSLNPFFASFCAHYGVEPDPALPYTPERKGKIERSFGGFVDGELLHRTYPSVEALQAALSEDDRRYAERLCAATGERPADRLERERPLLLPLPGVPFDPRLPEPRRVFSDSTISFRGARYSVPFQNVGKMLTVKEDPKSFALEIFDGAVAVAAHQKAPKGERVVVREHVEELLHPRWDRLREKRANPPPARRAVSDATPLVPWPEPFVDVRPLSVYAALAEGGRS